MPKSAADYMAVLYPPPPLPLSLSLHPPLSLLLSMVLCVAAPSSTGSLLCQLTHNTLNGADQQGSEGGWGGGGVGVEREG